MIHHMSYCILKNWPVRVSLFQLPVHHIQFVLFNAGFSLNSLGAYCFVVLVVTDIVFPHLMFFVSHCHGIDLQSGTYWYIIHCLWV